MVSDRIQAWMRGLFKPEDLEPALDLLADLMSQEREDAAGTERVQPAVVLLSGGDSQRFLEAAALAWQDWRDVLVAAGLAHDDWRDRLKRRTAIPAIDLRH
jgi:hypothetical protein